MSPSKPQKKNPYKNKLPEIVIAGGGWAGLAAALELTSHKIPVTVLESAKQLGGRARCVRFNDHQVDNGPHIMIGAYQNMLYLIELMKLKESDLLIRKPLRLYLKSLKTRKHFELRSYKLPAPLHLLTGLLTCSGLKTIEKWRAIRFINNMRSHNFILDRDINTLELLRNEKQSNQIIKNLWAPLCIATLNTPPERASAQVFIHVLQESFSEKRKHSDLLIPKTSLNAILPNPAFDFIERHGGRVELGQRVTELHIQNDRVTGLSVEGRKINANHIILALPHYATQKLLQSHISCKTISDKLAQLSTEPICTVYLQYPPQIKMKLMMTGLVDGISQWIFDRRICGQKGLMAVIISTDGEHIQMNNDELTQTVINELAIIRPDWPKPLKTMVIREKRATFSCQPGISNYRPESKTSIQGCWLAGDYTNTGLPATLEGSIRSGLECAHNIIQSIERDQEPTNA
jgi:squalene-associated FAD-dependent desaturase